MVASVSRAFRGGRKAAEVSSAPGRGLRFFTCDTSGATAMLFGLTTVAMLVFVGSGVDIGRWLHARQQTVRAVDAAVLAGARMLQIDGRDANAAMEAAFRFYKSNTGTRLPLESDNISFSTNDQRTEVTASGAAFIDTPFLSLIGIKHLPLLKLSGAEFSTAVLSVGGNAESNVEISMMLDVTGSMAGQKLTDLKAAAKDLIDIVVWQDQSNYTSRVALVPFSAGINGGLLAGQVGTSAASQTRVNLLDGSNPRWNLASTCLTERTGTNAFTDGAPTGSDMIGRRYTSNGECAPPNTVVPLTSDKAMLKTVIDGFEASGSTAGHLGTAWAWYMLSPNWGTYLGEGSRPASYSDLSATGSRGQPKLRKVAVLMTDGEYNIQYCAPGIPDRNSNGRNNEKGSCTAANGSSTQQARTLCQNMRTAGLTVYAVGFQLGNSPDALTTLRDHCASDSTTFYNANDGEQLRQAFRDIALKISTLHLSK